MTHKCSKVITPPQGKHGEVKHVYHNPSAQPIALVPQKTMSQHHGDTPEIQKAIWYYYQLAGIAGEFEGLIPIETINKAQTELREFVLAARESIRP